MAKLPRDLKIVDLSADFRLRDPEVYARWYGHPHLALELQAEAVYGLTEFYRDEIRAARLVAGPAATRRPASTALLPLLRAGVIDPDDIVIDLATGVSGAGRSAKEGIAARGGVGGLSRLQRRQAPPPGRVRPGVRAGRGAHGRGDLRAAPPAAEPRHPGDDLRPRRGGGDPRGAGARPTPTSRSWWCCRSARRRRPGTCAARTSCTSGVVPDRRPGRVMVFSTLDNLSQGILGPGDPERQPDARAARDHGADGGARCFREARSARLPRPLGRLHRFNRNDGWSMAGFIAFSGLLVAVPVPDLRRDADRHHRSAGPVGVDHRGAVRHRARARGADAGAGGRRRC